MTDNKTKYDFVIIGSGMSGLSTALILAKNGYKVIVLEKNHQIGGAMQIFSRDKRIFDTGVHYIGGLDKGQNLHQFLKYFEVLDRLNLHRLDEKAFDKIRLSNGMEIPHGQGYDNFKEGILTHFPNEENAIDLFISKVKDICAYFPLYNMEVDSERTYYTNPEILELGAWDFVSSITNNEDLKLAWLGSGVLYAGDAKTTPFYVVALIMNSFIMGSARLVDGGAQLTKELVRSIRNYGGEIQKRKEVVSVEFNNEKLIERVICSDGSSYEADNFISSMHPLQTIEMVGENHFLKAYVNRLKSLKNTVSSFMVYLTLEEGTFPYLNNNFYDYFTEDGWNTVDYTAENWPQVLYVCTPISSKTEKYADALSAMAYMSIEDLAKWESSFNTIAQKGERGLEYEQFKKEKEELVIQRLEKHFPDIRKSIRQVHSSTPLTYKNYLGTPEGELYGINKDFNNPSSTIINTRTKVKNLYLTGQNIVFHGILGATIGAFVTCFNFLDNKKILDEIKKL